MSDACPVCGLQLRSAPKGYGSNTSYSCQHCGDFALTGSLIAELGHLLNTDSDAAPKLSHALRQAQRSGGPTLFKTRDVQTILKVPLPRPREQADLLIRWLAENLPGPGEKAIIQFSTHGAVTGSKSSEGFMLIVRHLLEKQLIIGSVAESIPLAEVTLSLDGWDHYEALRRGAPEYRMAFMAMEFGHRELDDVVNTIFKPSVERAGFTLRTLIDNPPAGLIDNRLRVEIQASDFVVADLTHRNNGAYWEAGYAEGLGKPVIYTCEQGEFEKGKTHFDTNHHHTIVWDKGSPNDAGKDLTATIRATFPHLAKLVDDPD